MSLGRDAILKQIDEIIAEHTGLRAQSQYDDCSDLPKPQTTRLILLMLSAVDRMAPPGSPYASIMNDDLKKNGQTNPVNIPHLLGILIALRMAYERGYLFSVQELIHADVFADFLEMAEYLHSENYKDPAAVIAGSVLEEHLRKLCQKHGVPTMVTNRPKKADAMNNDLAASAIYSKLDQKSVTAWLDLRNKAAHGLYSEYTTDQVGLMIQGIRDFIARVPA